MNVKYDENGLVPAIIQNEKMRTVLMLGYMNEEALNKTLETKRVTFYSRSKQRLWTKGESSGNYLNLVSIKNDCDEDTLLIQVNPVGPTCHKGTETCWGETEKDIIDYLEDTIENRLTGSDDKSYVKSLANEGINKIAQKVGEEAVETVIESTRGDFKPDLFLNESADLLFHYLILLQAKGYKLEDVKGILEKRRK
ncbi:MAG: bifunctional phosphoribosyl-AMP cyclohydrolase/phosphoribosyl-ATP diphosphatase HisIE [Crocinitomicaceae bacterium]|nr:bifunctional phosphoribosyl-AMP cyclohydrolase/phosphoribosyl-ATP diphosphatase HisIE [Crocinitomicaceae bacterium]